MSYLLNSVDFTTYGIIPGHAPDGNIALSGCFDLPARIGTTFYEWGDENGIEPYVAEGEIFFGGRDMSLVCSIPGTRVQSKPILASLYSAIVNATELDSITTPYGDFDIWVKSITSAYMNGGTMVTFLLREPVVDITGGTLPASGSSAYTIDGIPMKSLGLYYSNGATLDNLPELKEQNFTISEAEGYQIVKRKHRPFEFDGFIMSSSLTDFQNKIKALYLLFSSTGTRTIILNGQLTVGCFAVEGFKISNVVLDNAGVTAKFKINLLCVTMS